VSSAGSDGAGAPGAPGTAAPPALPDPADPLSAAREICPGQLACGPRTKAQLAAAMGRRGIAEDIAEEILGRLTDVGLVDDAAFAAAWVESRHTGRGLARKALAHELRRRGVADTLVDEAVAELDPEQEYATARMLAARRLAGTRGLDPQVRFRRVAGLLARKGYSESLAYRIIREALEAEGVRSEQLPELDL
jgi:regulatory protein